MHEQPTKQLQVQQVQYGSKGCKAPRWNTKTFRANDSLSISMVFVFFLRGKCKCLCEYNFIYSIRGGRTPLINARRLIKIKQQIFFLLKNTTSTYRVSEALGLESTKGTTVTSISREVSQTFTHSGSIHTKISGKTSQQIQTVVFLWVKANKIN